MIGKERRVTYFLDDDLVKGEALGVAAFRLSDMYGTLPRHGAAPSRLAVPRDAFNEAPMDPRTMVRYQLRLEHVARTLAGPQQNWRDFIIPAGKAASAVDAFGPVAVVPAGTDGGSTTAIAGTCYAFGKINVTDPITGWPVTLELVWHPSGGLFAIDSSWIASGEEMTDVKDDADSDTLVPDLFLSHEDDPTQIRLLRISEDGQTFFDEQRAAHAARPSAGREEHREPATDATQTFTVVGLYRDTGERFAETYHATTPAAAEAEAKAGRPSLEIAGVFPGCPQVVA
jgi:hypothetical protein